MKNDNFNKNLFLTKNHLKKDSTRAFKWHFAIENSRFFSEVSGFSIRMAIFGFEILCNRTSKARNRSFLNQNLPFMHSVAFKNAAN